MMTTTAAALVAEASAAAAAAAAVAAARVLELLSARATGAHLGLVPASRVRQVQQLTDYIGREVPAHAPVLVAGDFNDWGRRVGGLMAEAGLIEWGGERVSTYPSRLPLAHLDHVYARGLQPLGTMVPRGRIWQRMSDHLPLVAEFALD